MEKPRQDPAARLLSLREYARTRNVALYTVQVAIRDGRITTTPDAEGNPKIDPATADAEFLANTDPSKQGRAKKILPPAPAGSEPAPAANTYQAHRTKKEDYEAKLRRLKYLEQKGRLLPADEVRDTALKLGRQLRDSILNLPDRLSALLAAETDPQRVNSILTDELTKAMEALSREIAGSD